MLTLNWLKDEENVVYGREEEIVPALAKDLMIPDLMAQIERFRQAPVCSRPPRSICWARTTSGATC